MNKLLKLIERGEYQKTRLHNGCSVYYFPGNLEYQFGSSTLTIDGELFHLKNIDLTVEQVTEALKAGKANKLKGWTNE